MFTTVNNVKQYTNVDVPFDLITRAQALVEIFIGRPELDVENTNDLIILDKMTAYQAAYMIDNEDVVYKQIAATSVGAGESAQNFNGAMSSPWMAPLAVLAARGLSFNKPRSVKTGRIFQWGPKMDWRRY